VKPMLMDDSIRWGSGFGRNPFFPVVIASVLYIFVARSHNNITLLFTRSRVFYIHNYAFSR
jgi:hypothetical protein